MATATPVLEGTYTSDPVHSSFGFSVKYMGVSTFRGTLDDATVSLTADGDRIAVEGSARVDSISIRTPEQFRAHVLGQEFFDVEHHPEVTFRSTEVRLGEDGSAEAAGELTMKGITHPVTATGRWTPPAPDAFGRTRGHLQLEATVDRRAYEFTWDAPLPNGGSALADPITISVDVSLIAQQD